MSAPDLLSELRAPPVVGRRYLVPVVKAVYFQRLGEWPVRGLQHRDIEHFKFHHLHYHIDARFIRADLARFLRNRSGQRSLQALADEFPIVGRLTGENERASLPKTTLVEMRCVRRDAPYTAGDMAAVKALNADMADAKAIATADGKRLCPHRRYDLSTVPVDKDGFVVCPLHGLRVDCRVSA